MKKILFLSAIVLGSFSMASAQKLMKPLPHKKPIHLAHTKAKVMKVDADHSKIQLIAKKTKKQDNMVLRKKAININDIKVEKAIDPKRMDKKDRLEIQK